MRGLAKLASARLAEGAVILAAAAALCGVLLSVPEGIVGAINERRSRANPQTWKQFALERDGTPRYHITTGWSHKQELTDFDGNTIAKGTNLDIKPRLMDWPHPFRGGGGYGQGHRDYRWWAWGFISPRRVYLLQHEGYLVCYDDATGMPDFYFSHGGISVSRPGPGDRFVETPGYYRTRTGQLLLVTDGKFYAVDPARRHYDVLYEAKAGNFSVGMTRGLEPRLTIIDGNRVLRMEMDGTVETSVAVSTEGVERPSISAASGDDGILAVRIRDRKSRRGRALVYDREGGLKAKYDFELPSYRRTTLVMPTWLVLVFFPLAAAVSLWHSRRSGLPRRALAAWAAFTFLTGPPGLAVYFGTREFVPRMQCRSCEKNRPVDQTACPLCGAGFARPERTGIEIIQ